MGNFFASLLKSYVGLSNRQRSGPRRYRSRSRALLTLEALEDRCVPSTLYVTNSGDDGSQPGTLRYAITHSSDGDTVCIKDSVTSPIVNYGTAYQIEHDMTIIAEARATISGRDTLRVFLVDGPNVSLVNLNIVAGVAYPFGLPGPWAAGVANFDGKLTLNNCRFSGNFGYTEYADAISNFDGTLIVNQCV